jgi:hypothetical protein
MIGALIIAASILLSTLMFAAGTRFIARETSNKDLPWLGDRLSGNPLQVPSCGTGQGYL